MANAALDFSKLKEKCDNLEDKYKDRNTLLDKMEQIHLLDWQDDKPNQDWMKLTVSPDGRNALIGAMRLLIATDPKISVPYDKSNDKMRQQSDLLEKAANIVYRTIGVVRQIPLHYDMVRSALMFGSVDMGIQLTADLAQTKRAQESKSASLRFEKIQQLTPFMVEVYDPRTCYQEYDAYGLASFYRKRTVLVGELNSTYGDAVLPFVAGKEDSDELTLCEYWDYVYHGLWIEGENNPIFLVEHKLPTMPIVSQMVEGSMLHSNVEDRIQPFLFTLYKSKLWDRQNLSLTAFYSNIFAIASNAMFKFTTNDQASKGPLTDWSTPGGMVILQSGEQLEPLAREAIDPAMQLGLEIANDKLTESTLYRQTLGEPLGSNAPYSMVSLLNQAGRLPLVPYQRLCGNAISQMLEKGFLLMKESGGGKTKLQGKDAVIELKTSDIPAMPMFDCTLDIALPQDDRQNAMVAQQVTTSGLASKRWARENYLQIGQSKEMDKERYQEQMDDFMLQQEFQRQMQQQQMQAQQDAMAQQQGMQAQQMQGMPPEMMGQQSPEMMGGMMPQGMPNPQQAQAGLPMTEPMTPQGEMPL